MFALALWDGRTRTLIAARDRAGEKPLYWTLTPRGLLLASEIKALLVRPEVDARARSRGARPVPDLRVRHRAAHDLQGHPQAAAGALPALPRRRGARCSATGMRPTCRCGRGHDDEAAEALREALRQAVASQMMADVPLGAFLSGGIDSSTHRRVHERGARGSPVNSFSMGFDDGSYNELPYAREVAALFGTRPSRTARSRPTCGELFDTPGRAPRRAVRRRLAVPDLPRVAAGARARDGGAVRRRRRRAVRRLRRLPGAGAGGALGGHGRRAACRRCAAVAAALPPTEKKKGLVNKFKRFIDGAAHGAARPRRTTAG